MLRLLTISSIVSCFLASMCLAAVTDGKGSSRSGTLASRHPAEVARKLDQLIEEEVWSALPSDSPQPAATADDYAFLRRATFDLIGHPPTINEITRFALDPADDKHSRLIDSLLESEWYGDNWARYWRDVVMFRRSDERGRIAAESFREYLSEQFNKNQPWNEIAASLITAEGDVRERGETAIIMAQMGRPEETVAELSRILLGIQIQCAQCHDHPFDRWEREQFHELAAFFPRVAARPKNQDNVRSFVVDASDRQRRRRGKGANRYQGTLEHFMPDLDDPAAEGELMVPRFFVTGEELPIGASDHERRDLLARQFTSDSNPWFSRSLVNRVWTELVGAGFYDAVDDLGPDRECHAPRTLDYLSQSFIDSGHDMKWLFATIMRTESYARQSRTRPVVQAATFLSNHPTRLRADQLFNALTQALRLPAAATRGRRTPNGARGVRALFATSFGYDPSLPAANIQSSVPQALQMMNSAVIDNFISLRRRDALAAMASNGEEEELVTELYLRCVSRPPHREELRVAVRTMKRADTRMEGMEDILWALLNSSEFLHRS